ncbi:AzlD domain-containing protein [Pokkaliibacter sp. CJK22405]|uniref:AzlD domain-containing protein n=1 Tax=Pokkaliibacter sp. CJK22405 TaxID=3384615 RepID=UPI00398551F6
MSSLTLFGLLITLSLLTFLPRYLPMLLADRFQLPPLLQRALAYVPIAVLTAIVVQTCLIQQHSINTHPANPMLWAGVVAGLLAWRRVNLLVVVIVGMLAYVAFRALL